MAEEVQLLKLVKAFTKIKSRQSKQEIIEFVEVALAREEACSALEKSQSNR